MGMTARDTPEQGDSAARAFGAEVCRRRKVLYGSPEEAAESCVGISWRRWRQIEDQNPPTTPRRASAIAIAESLEWPVNEALALLGYPPVDDTHVEVGSPAKLLRLYNLLPASSQQRVFKETVSEVVRSLTPPGSSSSDQDAKAS
jgi:hypothetical protein